MKKLYHKMTKQQFLNMAAIFCLLADVIILYYIDIKFNDFNYLSSMLTKSFEMQGGNINEVDPEIMKQLLSRLQLMFYVLYAIILLVHGLVYILFRRHNKSAIGYVKAMSIVAGIGTLFAGVIGLARQDYIETLLLVSAAGYLFSFIGLLPQDDSKFFRSAP